MRMLIQTGTFKNSPGYLPSGFVLRYSRTNATPYIVHRYVQEENGTKSYWDGGYYENLKNAMDDFNKRVSFALKNETFDLGKA